MQIWFSFKFWKTLIVLIILLLQTRVHGMQETNVSRSKRDDCCTRLDTTCCCKVKNYQCYIIKSSIVRVDWGHMRIQFL